MGAIDGKICVVTGANSGIGEATCRLLAADGATVVMVCRDKGRGQAALTEIRERTSNSNVHLYIADLASLDAVRAVAESIRADFDRVDVLVNNAGLWRAHRQITEDGFEVTLAVNHLAHVLLTLSLLDHLAKASGSVINVSSEAHRSGKLTRMPLEQIIRGEGRYRSLQAYSDSKLANVLFTFELAKRLEGKADVTTNAFHPGVLATRMWNQDITPLNLVFRLFKPFMGRPERGGEAAVRLAVDPDLEGVTGRYFNRLEESRASDAARDEELAARLWNLSAELIGVPA
jgi:NAD(P)-dependent dehydrogenase (short-subunit alcohol dehydrogenase family)